MQSVREQEILVFLPHTKFFTLSKLSEDIWIFFNDLK